MRALDVLHLRLLARLPWYGDAASEIRAEVDPFWQRTGDGGTRFWVFTYYWTEGGEGAGEYEVFADNEDEAEEIGRRLQRLYFTPVNSTAPAPFYEIYSIKAVRADGGQS